MAQTKKGVKKAKEKYGADCYRRWGRLGGNPAITPKRRKK